MIRSLLPLLLLAGASLATEVRYANEAAELLQGARLPAVAGVTLGLPPDPGGIGRSPAGLAEYQHPELVVHHAVLYSGLGATQDEILLAVPLQPGVGLGGAISRVGADGIMRVGEGEDPDFQNPKTFSASDWVGTLGIGRAWFDGRLLGGAAVRFLYRDLDQTGIGAQTEASLLWKSPMGWRVGTRLDRGFGSFAGWESGRREYSPSDVMVGAGIEKRMPYFYGKGLLAWESPGLFQEEGNTTFTDKDARLTTDPWLFLRASRLGGEFQFDFGGVLRAGCEIQALTRLTDFLQSKDEQGLFGESSGMVSFGAGYLWANRARIDYALVVDPDLGSMHRVALGLVFGVPRKSKQAKTDDVPLQAPLDTIAPAVVPDSAKLDSSAAPVVSKADSATSVSPSDSVRETIVRDSAAQVPPVASASDTVAPSGSASVSVPLVDSTAVAPSPSAPDAIVAPAVAPQVAPEVPPRPVVPPPVPAPKTPSSDDEWDAPETKE